MPSGCSIRALWVISNQDSVMFSRKFPVVEKRWRLACEKEAGYRMYRMLPTDLKLVAALIERKKREGSARGNGLRLYGPSRGSDSWVDDPIIRNIICLSINGEENGEDGVLWPLVLNVKGPYSILVLPLVEPPHLETYVRMCSSPDCASVVGADESMSSLLLELPSITGAFAIANTIGDIVNGESMEPEVIISTTSSVGGLLDSLTGGIPGISTRTKPAAAPATASAVSGTAVRGSVMFEAPKIGSKSFDKDLLRSFISYAMPFGSPLDLGYSNISAIRNSGFPPADIPPADRKQPAWKPYLYRGKQRILFTVHERVNAAMYDRDEIPDRITISSQVNCRAELEGLPDVSFPFRLDSADVESLSFHPCAQVPEHGEEKQMITFCPPSGNFVLIRYQSLCSLGPPVKGFYQLSMVSENEGAFLFKLSLMENYKSPVIIEFCTVTMPFPKRRVVSFEGTPSIGTVSSTDHSVEWKVIANSRSLSGKNIEANFPGTVRFAPWQAQRLSSIGSKFGSVIDEESDSESESTSNASIEDHMVDRMSKDLLAADLDEPFCWKAYNYAEVSFRIMGTSLTGMLIDPKSVNIFPSVKAPVEVTNLVTSGDYILWNTLGRCPVAATP